MKIKQKPGLRLILFNYAAALSRGRGGWCLDSRGRAPFLATGTYTEVLLPLIALALTGIFLALYEGVRFCETHPPDVVNVASRLQAAPKEQGMAMLCDDATATVVKDTQTSRREPCGSISIREKQEEITVWSWGREST